MSVSIRSLCDTSCVHQSVSTVVDGSSRSFLALSGAGADTETMVHVGNGFYIAKQLHDRLFDYQRDGIPFLWKLFVRRKEAYTCR